MRKTSRTAPWPKTENDCKQADKSQHFRVLSCYTVEEISTGRYLSMSPENAGGALADADHGVVDDVHGKPGLLTDTGIQTAQLENRRRS